MRLDWLPDVLRADGLTVHEVSGWRARGKKQLDPRVIVDHHTGGAVGSPAPSLRICTTGRPDLAGPLCNILTGRDGTVHVIASGISNNAGRGGIARYQAEHNWHTIGHEIEHRGDIRLELINLDQLAVAARVDAAICRRLGWDALRCVAHKEWAPGRKVDPVWSQDDHVGRVAQILNRQPPPPSHQESAVPALIDLSGVVAYVDLLYEEHGRAVGADLAGRRWWVHEAALAPDPWTVLDKLAAALATEGT